MLRTPKRQPEKNRGTENKTTVSWEMWISLSFSLRWSQVYVCSVCDVAFYARNNHSTALIETLSHQNVQTHTRTSHTYLSITHRACSHMCDDELVCVWPWIGVWFYFNRYCSDYYSCAIKSISVVSLLLLLQSLPLLINSLAGICGIYTHTSLMESNALSISSLCSAKRVIERESEWKMLICDVDTFSHLM